MSADKRARVDAAISELRFRPNAAARALVSGRAKIIAVVAGNTSQYGYAETIRGIEEGARAAGYLVTITVVESAAEEVVDRAASLVLAQAVAGVIVLKFDPPGVAALQRFPADLPRVAIAGVRQTGVAQVVLAEAEAAEKLTDYLLGLGHRTVHHVRVPPSRREDGRTTGWRRALRKAGIAAPPIIEASWDPASGRAAGRELALRDDVTAIFCGNDEVAIGVIKGLADRGRRVPEDFSVVGFDDHPLAALWSPALTTVRQDFAALGNRACEMLLGLMQETLVHHFSTEPAAVIIRDSAGPPR